MTTAEISPGIYRIVFYTGGPAVLCLTRVGGKYVDFTKPCSPESNDNLWEIIPDGLGNVIIKVPKQNSYLTYECVGNTNLKLKTPKRGMAVVYLPSDKPPNQWQFVTDVPGFRYFLRVAGSTLGIKVAPQPIQAVHKLELGFTDQLKWVPEFVRKE